MKVQPLALIVLALAGWTSVRAEPAKGPDPEQVRSLVKQLDDDEFDVRQKADAELRRLGNAVVPLLEKELKDTRSAEVRARLGKILDALQPLNALRPLIERLGNDRFEVREKATQELFQRGKEILPLLREEAKKAIDLEVRYRLEAVIKKLAE